MLFTLEKILISISENTCLFGKIFFEIKRSLN